jgi:hypothetical protein
MTQPVDQTSREMSTAGGHAGRLGRTDLCGVVGGTEDQLGRPVVARANVRHVWLVLDKDLGTAKVAELEDAAGGVEEEVLRLDVAVAYALGVDVGQRAEELVDVQLDLEDGHDGLELAEVPRGAIDGFGDVFQDQVQVDLVSLRGNQRRAGGAGAGNSRARRYCSRRP